MPNLHEIIEQIQKDLVCPVCGRNYDIGEIKIKGLFDKTLIIQTVCANGHITLFMTTYQKREKNPPFNTDDLLDLHNKLKDFDGNFERIWPS